MESETAEEGSGPPRTGASKDDDTDTGPRSMCGMKPAATLNTAKSSGEIIVAPNSSRISEAMEDGGGGEHQGCRDGRVVCSPGNEGKYTPRSG